MIQAQTRIKIVDNSGGKEAMCIRVLDSTVGKLGSTIIGVIKKASPRKGTQTRSVGQNKQKKKVEEKQIHRILIVASKKETCRRDGTRIRFNVNAGVVINQLGQPQSTRIKSPLPLEVRKPLYHKLLFLAHAYV